jgi:hypothetical protein
MILFPLLSAGIVDNDGKFVTDVVDTGGVLRLANLSENFRKI